MEAIPVAPSDSSPTQPKTFQDAVFRHFHEASGDSHTRRYYQVGGETLCLLCANETIAQLITPALAHLEQETGPEPALTLHLWDQASTGVSLPPSPFSRTDFGPRHEVRWQSLDGVAIYYEVWSGVFSMLDVARREGFWWAHDIYHLPEYVRAEPLRTLLQRWFARVGSQFVHGAAVGSPSGAVLIVGAGGSGKSTTTLACLQAGLSILGDDYCLVRVDGQSPRVYSVYSSAKVDPHSPAWRPDYGALDIRDEHSAVEKAVLMLAPTYRASLITDAPIRAIVLPQVSAQEPSALQPVSRAAALRALAPSTLLQMAGAGQHALDLMARLVQCVPAYALTLGEDMQAVPQLIRQLLVDD